MLQIFGNLVVVGVGLFLVYKGIECLIEWGHRSIDDDLPFPWLGPIDIVLGCFGAGFSLNELMHLL